MGESCVQKGCRRRTEKRQRRQSDLKGRSCRRRENSCFWNCVLSFSHSSLHKRRGRTRWPVIVGCSAGSRLSDRTGYGNAWAVRVQADNRRWSTMGLHPDRSHKRGSRRADPWLVYRTWFLWHGRYRRDHRSRWKLVCKTALWSFRPDCSRNGDLWPCRRSALHKKRKTERALLGQYF